MHPILAQGSDAVLLGLGLFFGGICTALLALGAIIPAWRGNRPLAFALSAPAFLLGVAGTIWFVCDDTVGGANPGGERTTSDVVVLWTLMAGPPLFTSLLVLLLLFLRRRRD